MLDRLLDALFQYKDHPFRILFATFFAFGFGVAAAVILYWEQFTGAHLLPFLRKGGWLDVPFWYHVLVIVLLCATLVLQVSVVKAFCQFRRWQNVRWLERLAQEDGKNMKRLVFSEFGNLSATLDLNPKSPHAMFYVHVVNNSIYPLTIEEKVDRRITFDSIPLDEAQIYWPPGAISNVKAKPRNRYSFAVIQRLPQSVVDSIQSRERFAFGTENVAVWFTYRDYAGIVGRLRIEIGSRVTFPKG
jgi:hypothetical protein